MTSRLVHSIRAKLVNSVWCRGSQCIATLHSSFLIKFDFKKDAISVIGGKIVSKQSLGWGGGEQKYNLAIVDPFGDENIGRTVSPLGIDLIKGAFREAESILAGSRPHDLFKPVEDSHVN
ncbi:hypothetical protein POM88_037860 [Heracleum sosnowskyi]|uniref:PAP-associated domain-containing protein n=1 Tax=Heracleum sosnowskyi TaxID=360622 RepID=A0AAD8HRW4_9APIA|nr:hypothetical protein POM88_037860 [Heracleum sosnowskyi]